jgi:hypothetical protein
MTHSALASSAAAASIISALSRACSATRAGSSHRKKPAELTDETARSRPASARATPSMPSVSIVRRMTDTAPAPCACTRSRKRSKAKPSGLM